MSEEAATLDEILAARRGAAGEIVSVDQEGLTLVIFALGTALFAFPGHSIQEVLPYGGVFAVPGCPDILEGVINVRGDIESVLRLSRVLDLEEAPPGRHTAILLGSAAGVRSGLRVDSVTDVTAIPASLIHPPLPTLPERWRPLVTGTFTRDAAASAPVLVLNLERLFQDTLAPSKEKEAA